MAVEAIADWRAMVPRREAPAPSEAGTVIAFRPRPPAGNRFSMRDRARLLDWSKTAGAVGVRRIAIEGPDPDDDPRIVGDFALIYRADTEWARWAVAPEEGRYLLWSPNTGETIGNFPSLHAALAAIHHPED